MNLPNYAEWLSDSQFSCFKVEDNKIFCISCQEKYGKKDPQIKYVNVGAQPAKKSHLINHIDSKLHFYSRWPNKNSKNNSKFILKKKKH
jgi:hypothetical protein